MLAIAMSLLAAAAPSAGGVCTPSVREITAEQSANAKASLSTVFVTCGRMSVNLGKASTYQSSTNEALHSIVVILTDPFRTRVNLVSLTGDNILSVQDISPDLAKLAGRPFDTTLQGQTVDLAQFAANGTVEIATGKAASTDKGAAVQGATGRSGNISAAAGGQSRLDLAAYVDAAQEPAAIAR